MVRRPGRVAHRTGGRRLALVSTPLARSEQREGSVAWPLLIEAALVITAIAVLIPWFAVLAARDSGRDGRFDDVAAAAPAAPQASSLCAGLSGRVDAVLLDYMCGRAQPPRDHGTSAAAPNRPDDAQSDRTRRCARCCVPPGGSGRLGLCRVPAAAVVPSAELRRARGVALALFAWAAGRGSAACRGRSDRRGVRRSRAPCRGRACPRRSSWDAGAALAALCFAPWASRALATVRSARLPCSATRTGIPDWHRLAAAARSVGQRPPVTAISRSITTGISGGMLTLTLVASPPAARTPH